MTSLLAFVLIILPLSQPPAQKTAAADGKDLAAARQLFRQGDFHGAAAQFRQITDSHPNAAAYAGLTESLLKVDDVKSADESSQRALIALADSAAVHAARGDVYFRRGLIPDAQEEYQTALKLDDKCARAWLGQGKVDAVFARREQARRAVTKARELDPEDGDVLYEWAIRQPYPDNVAALEKHLAEFHNDDETERHEREYKEFIKALAGRRVWVPAKEVERTEIKLEVLTIGASMVRRGFGVRVRLNDRATVTLLLDTGSSGIIITRKLAEKIGARRLSEQSLEGVGKGATNVGYKAWVDKVVVGDLEFHDCYLQATPHEIAQADGTIGTDVFTKYLVTLDFPGRKLRLDPLPGGSQTEPGTEAGVFTQAYNFGHFLLLSTDIGKKATGLFVVDSGANANTISPELAKAVPDMRLFNSPVSGASGQTNSAFIADNATLRFAQVQKKGERISTVDLHSVSKDLGVEISGQIGFSAMEEMKLTINYRDGLVAFMAK